MCACWKSFCPKSPPRRTINALKLFAARFSLRVAKDKPEQDLHLISLEPHEIG